VEPESKRQSLKKLRTGRREAYEALICQHYKPVYRFLAYLTADSALAEELTQETFAAAWANIARYKSRASFGTWLHQIAYHKFIDAKRSRQRNAALLAKLKSRTNDDSETSNPLNRITIDEDSRSLYEAMTRLNSSEYLVILLHYIQAFSYRQVAQVLGEPIGTVKWQTNRALKKLRLYLTGRAQP
jgi:RNA polymerase sigma-70 factor (ECF subfamily)